MSQFSCSFAVHCTSACDVSTRYPDRTHFFPLNSCVSDAKANLRELQTTQSCVTSEGELILARVGLFDEKAEDMVICPKHRALLGVKYCPSRKCQHPLHGRRKGKVSRGVNLKMSKEIKETWDVLVPAGSVYYGIFFAKEKQTNTRQLCSVVNFDLQEFSSILKSSKSI